jgi:hypothetical protein
MGTTEKRNQKKNDIFRFREIKPTGKTRGGKMAIEQAEQGIHPIVFMVSFCAHGGDAPWAQQRGETWR